MKKNEFEQQMEMVRMQHEHALEDLRLRHQNRIEAMRVMGEEIRMTLSHAKDTLMPLYEHLGSEQTYALLKTQLEQSVAMFTHLGEKALAVAEKKVEADASTKLSRTVEDTMKMLIHEVERIYFAGRDDGDAAFVKDSLARSFRDAGCEVAEDTGSDDDDDDLVS